MRRFIRRAPKDYRWAANATTFAGLDIGEVVHLNLLTPTDWSSGAARETINVRRIVFDLQVRFRDEVYEFTGPSLQVSSIAWAVFLIDADDDETYEPLSAVNLTEETVLGFGQSSEVFGVGSYAVLGTIQTAQTSIPFSGSFAVDLRTNRRVTSNQHIILAVAQDPSISLTDEEVIGRVTSRVLLQKISR